MDYVTKVAVALTLNNTGDNAGVVCPGQSLEQFVGSLLIVDEMSYKDAYVLVEISCQQFGFKFEQPDRVQIGLCEWCNTKSILSHSC